MAYDRVTFEVRYRANIYNTDNDGREVNIFTTLGEYETNLRAEEALDNSDLVSPNKWNGIRWNAYYKRGRVSRDLVEVKE